MAHLIIQLYQKASAKELQCGPQLPLNRGLKKFGDRGRAAAAKEVGQLHDRVCFKPVLPSTMTESEKKKVVDSILLLTEKRDSTVKGRMVYNGKPTRVWMKDQNSASPTVSLESILLLAVIDALEERDIMTSDIPNAFIQSFMPEVKPGEDRCIMKAVGLVVDLLVEKAPTVYGPKVVFENGKKVLYLQLWRPLYGHLLASLFWYIDFRGSLENEQHFVFNPYDPCVANRIVEGKQHTIRFHVDDLKSSHVDKKVNDEFLKWLNKKYGKFGEVTSTRGKSHDYLGMMFDYSQKGKVIIDMTSYMKEMVKEFPEPLIGTVSSPAPDDLFAEGKGALLDKKRAEIFHTFVAKALFACKRARPDIHPTVAVLCTRVKAPNEDDWRKLVRLMKYIKQTADDKLTLRADSCNVIKWYVDASFAVHPDFKSHTGAVMTMGSGAIQSMSRKQKLNTRSSTEAELVGADDAANAILWTKLFLESQGVQVDENILYQDNKSTILLLENGKRSSSQRTRAINIRYFFLTDQIEKKNLTVKYCPTLEMRADFMSKPLQGKLFADHADWIMGRK